MDVSERGDCHAIDIVEGKDSLPTTSRCNSSIFTLLDCFTRYAVAVSFA